MTHTSFTTFYLCMFNTIYIYTTYIELLVFPLQLDLCAVGVEILVPYINDTYTIGIGTSFACPLVAGKAAFVKKEFEKKMIKLSLALTELALMTTISNIIFLVFYFLFSFFLSFETQTLYYFPIQE